MQQFARVQDSSTGSGVHACALLFRPAAAGTAEPTAACRQWSLQAVQGSSRALASGTFGAYVSACRRVQAIDTVQTGKPPRSITMRTGAANFCLESPALSQTDACLVLSSCTLPHGK